MKTAYTFLHKSNPSKNSTFFTRDFLQNVLKLWQITTIESTYICTIFKTSPIYHCTLDIFRHYFIFFSVHTKFLPFWQHYFHFLRENFIRNLISLEQKYFIFFMSCRKINYFDYLDNFFLFVSSVDVWVWGGGLVEIALCKNYFNLNITLQCALGKLHPKLFYPVSF